MIALQLLHRKQTLDVEILGISHCEQIPQSKLIAGFWFPLATSREYTCRTLSANVTGQKQNKSSHVMEIDLADFFFLGRRIKLEPKKGYSRMPFFSLYMSICFFCFRNLDSKIWSPLALLCAVLRCIALHCVVLKKGTKLLFLQTNIFYAAERISGNKLSNQKLVRGRRKVSSLSKTFLNRTCRVTSSNCS